MFNFFRQHRSYARLPAAIPLQMREERLDCCIRGLTGPHQEEFKEFPRFGPLYAADESSIMKGYKDEAWEHVLVKTGGDELEITENYLNAIGDVEREAINSYADLTMVESETGFRWMMLKDGCFLIQLAILVLGGSHQLGYRKNQIIFGTPENNDDRWLKSMFYVGNQIPLVILWKLVEQPFFKILLAARQWEEPSDLLKKLLYELLIAPYMRKAQSSCQITFPTASRGPLLATNSQLDIQRCSNLLDILYRFVIGQSKSPKAKLEGIDLELGDEGFHCATYLSQKGIRFKNKKEMGCEGIDYKSSKISKPVLFLPTLTVDGNTELMFHSLKLYEMTQPMQQQAVCAYLKLMSELVRTTEDVNLLASEGIIASDLIHTEKSPQILSRLAQSESSQLFWRIRLQTNQYSKPSWVKYKEIFGIAVLLTALQTIISILTFVHDMAS